MSLDVTLYGEYGEELYSDNITHNLWKMATEAGIYDCLWTPEENCFDTAAQLIHPLSSGLTAMALDYKRFKEFDAPNGWGKYDDFLAFVARYLAACKENPKARVSVSR
jgi:hypothetical protein